MTDEGLVRQLETANAIHDAIFPKRSAIADATDEVEEPRTITHDCPDCGGHERGETT